MGSLIRSSSCHEVCNTSAFQVLVHEVCNSITSVFVNSIYGTSVCIIACVNAHACISNIQFSVSRAYLRACCPIVWLGCFTFNAPSLSLRAHSCLGTKLDIWIGALLEVWRHWFVLGPPLLVGRFGFAVQPGPNNHFHCSLIFTYFMKCAVLVGLDTRFASVLPLLPTAPSVDVKASQTPPCWGSFLAQGSLELGSRRSMPSLGCLRGVSESGWSAASLAWSCGGQPSALEAGCGRRRCFCFMVT